MTTTTSSKYEDTIEARISPFIKRVMRLSRITGLSIALVDENGPVLVKGYGFADRRAQQAATQRTIYKIGSITKVFTGTAAMQLYEKGLLDIDKPVGEYLPEFSVKSRKGDGSKITPRMLMTHHSGLPADWYDDYWNDDPHAFRQVLKYLRECQLAFTPNTVFSYSNLATSLMGIVIERVSQLSYQDYVERNILSPLGMRDSSASADKLSAQLLSKAYAGSVEADDPILRDAPAGAIYSSVEDMARFMGMILAGGAYKGVTILHERTLAAMLSPQNEAVKLDLGFRIGLNWMLSRPALSFAGRVCWHDGGSPHFFSMLMVLPEAKLGAVVLSNSDGGMVNAGIIAEEMLKQATAIKTGKRAATSDLQAVSERGKIEGQEPATGTFASANGVIQIFQHNHSLRAMMQGQQFSLTPAGGGWYGLRLLLYGFIPVKAAGLANLRMTVRSIEGRRILGMEQYGIQVPFGTEYAARPVPEVWAEAVGEYRLITENRLPPFSSLILSLEEGILFLRLTARKVGKLELALEPISEAEGTILGFGRLGGVTVELSDRDEVKTLKILGLEFVKV
jgi:CubicO group peptidase (beta-lactamase class C family)